MLWKSWPRQMSGGAHQDPGLEAEGHSVNAHDCRAMTELDVSPRLNVARANTICNIFEGHPSFSQLTR